MRPGGIELTLLCLLSELPQTLVRFINLFLFSAFGVSLMKSCVYLDFLETE